MRLKRYNKKLMIIGSIVLGSLILNGCQMTADDMVGDPVEEVSEDLDIVKPDDRNIIDLPGYEKRWQNDYRQSLKDEAKFLTSSNYMLPADIAYSAVVVQEICIDVITNDRNMERVAFAKEVNELAKALEDESDLYEGTIEHPSNGMQVYDLSVHGIKERLVNLQNKLNEFSEIKTESKK